MSHRIKTNTFFTPETVVSNVLVPQVRWEAVPDTWSGSSKAPEAKCVVCATVRGMAHDSSVDERSRRLGPFKTKCNVVGQARGQRREDKACQFEVDTSLDREPVQLTQNWRDVPLV